MCIVDSAKIAELRDVIEGDVAYMAIEHCCSRPEAYLRLAERLGYYLRISPLSRHENQWYCCAAAPLLDVDSLKHPERLRKAGTLEDVQRRVEFCSLNTECWALTPDEACIGTLLLCLDSNEDIYSNAPLWTGVGLEEWDRLFNGNVPTDLTLSDPAQQALFESDIEYQERLQLLDRMRLFDATWHSSIGNGWPVSHFSANSTNFGFQDNDPN